MQLEVSAIVNKANNAVQKEIGKLLSLDYFDSEGNIRVNVGQVVEKMQVRSDKSLQTIQEFAVEKVVETKVPMDQSPFFDIVQRRNPMTGMDEKVKVHHADIPNVDAGAEAVIKAVLADEAKPEPKKRPGRPKKTEATEEAAA